MSILQTVCQKLGTFLLKIHQLLAFVLVQDPSVILEMSADHYAFLHAKLFLYRKHSLHPLETCDYRAYTCKSIIKTTSKMSLSLTLKRRQQLPLNSPHTEVEKVQKSNLTLQNNPFSGPKLYV